MIKDVMLLNIITFLQPINRILFSTNEINFNINSKLLNKIDNVDSGIV